MHLFLLFRVFFMFFSVFIAIGNFPALTSLLSIDDLTGSTVIPLIAHEAGKKHRNTQIHKQTFSQKTAKTLHTQYIPMLCLSGLQLTENTLSIQL